MSSIGAIAATSSATGTQANSLGMQDFLNILLTQLTYQDPLKPMDNQQFMAQMAQFTTLGQTQELNSKIGSLLSTQASMQSVGLIGRMVEFNTEQGALKGIVDKLSWAGDTPKLSVMVNNQPVDVLLSQVVTVSGTIE